MTPKDLLSTLQDPREIIKELDKHIIGQESAKKALAILSMNRAMMLLNKFGLFGKETDLKIHKTNVLLIGPTGSGKSSIVKAFSDIIDVPITTFDCTSITEAGYIGGKVEDILIRYSKDFHKNESWKRLQRFSSGILKEMALTPEALMEDGKYISEKFFETGIIFIDEIDKIATRDSQSWKGKDEHIQNELLKFLEGAEVDLTSHRNSSSSMFSSEKLPKNSVNTTDLFFIMGGAFHGLDDIIRTRINKKAGIGFGHTLPNRKDVVETSDILGLVTTDDLIEYGFKPEFIGRIPVRANLTGMTKEILKSIILNSEESPYKRYINFFASFGITLSIDDSGLEAVSEIALQLNTGARALNNIFHSILEKQLINIYDMVGETILINSELVSGVKVDDI